MENILLWIDENYQYIYFASIFAAAVFSASTLATFLITKGHKEEEE